jgi:hypothetical protein
VSKNYRDFSDEREVFPFRVSGQWYVLQEQDAAAIGRYKSKQAKKGKIVNKTVVVGDISDSEVELLVECVREADVELIDDEAHVRKIGGPVDVATIRRWRAVIVSDLFDRAARMNGVNDDAREEEKNS